MKSDNVIKDCPICEGAGVDRGWDPLYRFGLIIKCRDCGIMLRASMTLLEPTQDTWNNLVRRWNTLPRNT